MISRNTFGSLQVETITTAVKAHLPRPCPYQECIEQYQLHMTCMEAAEAYTPKHHLMFHPLYMAASLGNPRLYSSWLSEAKNKVLKMACRQVSQATFEATVLFRMRAALQKTRKRTRAG